MTEDADQPLTTWLPMVLDDNVFATIIGRRGSGKSALVARHPWLPGALS